MPDQLQLRGGTTSEHSSFTGALREVTVDTTKKTLVVHDGSQAGGTPLMKESGATAASSVQIGTGGVERFKITANEVVFNETSTDTDFRIEGNGDANLFKVDAGNDRIGIGTSSPETLLHAKVNTFSDDINKVALTLSNNQSSGVHQYFQNGSTGTGVSNGARIGLGNTDNFLIQHFEAKDIQISTNSTERMRIDSTGRVRIGCTAQPSSTVSGAQFDAGGKTLRISQGGGTSSTLGASVQITGGGSSTSVGAAAAMGAILTLKNCNNTDNNQTSIDFMASTGLSTSKVIGKNDSHSSRNGSLIFATSSAAAPAERMRIDSSGNVGIGTVSPDGKLSVTGDIVCNSGTVRSNDGFVSDADLIFNADANANSNNSIIFKESNTERMRMDFAGRLLHGVTSGIPVCSSANSRLQVHNNASVLTASFTGYGNHSGGAIIALGKSRSNTIGDATGAVANGDTLGDIRFGGSDGTDMHSTGAQILAKVDGSVSSNTLPTRISFQTNNGTSLVEHVRINSAGQFRAGNECTSNRTSYRHQLSTAGGDGDVLSLQNPSNTDGQAIGLGFWARNTNNAAIEVAKLKAVADETQANNTQKGSLRFLTNVSGSLGERMRITDAGEVLIGTTSTSNAAAGSKFFEDGKLLHIHRGDSNTQLFLNKLSGSDGTVATFAIATATKGSISVSSTGTTYAVTSDYRLKENVVSISDGITRLKQLLPKRFNFIADETNSIVDGFLAHEVSSIVPNAVTGKKDAVDKDGNIDPQQLDQSKLIPLLVAAVQELIGKVEVLEAA